MKDILIEIVKSLKEIISAFKTNIFQFIVHSIK